MVIFEFLISEVIPPEHRDRIINTTWTETTYVLASPYRSACAFVTCLPPLHLLHLNVSWVSQIVVSLNKKSCRKSSREKCLSVSSFSSTTAEERACLFACLWKIFSSIVPVDMKRYTKPDDWLRFWLLGNLQLTFFLLTITPYTRKGLLICSRVPIWRCQCNLHRINVERTYQDQIK